MPAKPKTPPAAPEPRPRTEPDPSCCPRGLFWPIALIAVGTYWLARNLGWLDVDFPWFPVLLIVAGAALVLRNSRRP